MKYFYLYISILFPYGVFSQIPSGYYDSATGTGYTLKTQLYNIINNHIDQGYNAMDAFIASYDLDTYYEVGSNTILDVYSENPTGDDPYTFSPIEDECGNYNSEGDCYNKEHIVPQSVFGSAVPMYSDAFNLLPTDGRVNGFRSNYPYGVVDDNNLINQSGITNPTLNGSKLGNNLNSGYSSGYSGIVFEPINEFKGDIARSYFYFVTRYENQVSNWSAYDMFDGSSDKAIADPFLSILLTWHENDPVSDKEIDRNNNIYNYQGNRNPFIDHPEWVDAIWNATSDSEAPTAPTNLSTSNPTASSINLSWNASTDNVAVDSYDIFINGSFSINTVNPITNFTVTGLSSETNYCFTVFAKDASGNTSTSSNETCATTTSNNSGTIDIFFSEYIEGSGTNKALEIANFTGSTINLSDYTIRLAINGGSFGSDYPFPNGSSISNEDVFVIANSGLLAECQSQQDYVNNTVTGFNGNDAIGLFKNGTLIDIIGTEGSSSDFAKDITLIRKPTVQFPTTTFDINEWNTAPQDDCSNLGLHTQTLSIQETSINYVTFYPNPTKGNAIYFKTSQTLNIELYNILGKKVLNQKVDRQNNRLILSNLSQGIYLLKISNQNQTITKKLVKQ